MYAIVTINGGGYLTTTFKLNNVYVGFNFLSIVFGTLYTRNASLRYDFSIGKTVLVMQDCGYFILSTGEYTTSNTSQIPWMIFGVSSIAGW